MAFTDYIKSAKALSLLTEIIFIVVLSLVCLLFHIICHPPEQYKKQSSLLDNRC